MFIDTWGGWAWTCPHCDSIGRIATDQEVEEYERELNEHIGRKKTLE